MTTPPHEGGDCAPGWESYGANCYWFMPDDHVTWNTAQVPSLTHPYSWKTKENVCEMENFLQFLICFLSMGCPDSFHHIVER